MNNGFPLTKNSQGLAAEAASVAAARPRPIERAIPTRPIQSWGRFPALSLIGAVGLILVALANALSRSGEGQYEILLWAGVLTLIVPVAVRLASAAPTRRERISLVLLSVLGLYLMKVLHSPQEFIFSDELVHLHNVNSILQNGTLFNSNSILSVTPLYPGLETITAAFASLSGLSAFSAGLMIIGHLAKIVSVQSGNAIQTGFLFVVLLAVFNAAGRISEADMGLRLLTCEDTVEARAIALGHAEEATDHRRRHRHGHLGHQIAATHGA